MEAQAQSLNSAEQAKLALMQDLEIEMMSDLYNRMTSACHKKCIPPKYVESELGMQQFSHKQTTEFIKSHLIYSKR